MTLPTQFNNSNAAGRWLQRMKQSRRSLVLVLLAGSFVLLASVVLPTIAQPAQRPIAPRSEIRAPKGTAKKSA